MNIKTDQIWNGPIHEHTTRKEGDKADSALQTHGKWDNGDGEGRREDGEGGDGSEVQPMLEIGIFRP